MSWENLSKETPVARKDRRCIWCAEKIKKGAAYIRNTGKFEGQFQSNAFHTECWDAAGDYFRSGEEEFEPYAFKRGQLTERTKTLKDLLNE